MTALLSLPMPGTLGNIVGGGSDGVIIGQITPADPTKALLKRVAAALPLCYTDDGGLYVDKTTDFRSAADDDVSPFPAVPVAEDAVYFGLAAGTFSRVDLDITTAAVDLVGTVAWEYWDGSSWTALSDLVDGTTGWTVTPAAIVTVSFTVPEDWAACTVDSVNAFWIRSRFSAYTSETTLPLIGTGYIVGSAAQWDDDLTDLTDADAGDVDLLPDYPLVGDGFYIGYTEKFSKVKITTSQAITGTNTITLKYWDGDSWEAVTVFEDDTAGWVTGAGTLFIHFVPPSDWVANTAANGPNGQAGFFVVMELTALTDVTQQPQATQAWVLPLSTGCTGIPAPATGTITKVRLNALTTSAGNNDSVFILVNFTTGLFETITWTKQDTFDVHANIALAVTINDALGVIQIKEDGSTEYADATMFLTL